MYAKFVIRDINFRFVCGELERHYNVIKLQNIMTRIVVRFSDAGDERDPEENLFNEVNTQNFECSYLFPNEIESFLSEKGNSETINVIHVNLRSLSKNFDNLSDILRGRTVALMSFV